MDARPGDHGGIRPRFEMSIDADGGAVLDRIQEHLRASDFGCRGWVAPPYAELEVQAATKHFWSPRLAIYAADDDDGEVGCTLHCRFEPEPNVWTMYMAAWGMLAVGGACGVAWTCALWIMGTSVMVPALFVGGASVLALALYSIALSGQRLAGDQMSSLRDALDEALRYRGRSRRGS